MQEHFTNGNAVFFPQPAYVTMGAVVVVCVCVSVKSHLTFGASVLPENAVMDSAGNGDGIFCGVFFETALFQSYGTSCIVRLLYNWPFSHCGIGYITNLYQTPIVVSYATNTKATHNLNTCTYTRIRNWPSVKIRRQQLSCTH